MLKYKSEMLKVLKCLFAVNFLSNFACGLIPNLSVQMLDKEFVARKRQDTLDMCRIFAAENDKTLSFSMNEPQPDNNRPYNGNIRSKRVASDIKLGSSPVSAESAKRIENTVYKLYEDLRDAGEKGMMNKTMTRYNFAPGELDGPLPTSTTKKPGQYDPKEASIHWPKRWKHGIVPYFIDSKTYDSQLTDIIMKAFDYFESATCIRLQKLRDRPTDTRSLQNVEWLYISNPSGIRQCVHSNERKKNKGVQMVVLGYDCLSLGEIVHEVMHILGFSHEHTRPDRDQHITVLWNNIKPGYKKYFEIRSEDHLISIPYDYSSVLHYPSRAFSKNGQFTISSRNSTKFGQREGLSVSDIEKVGLVYGSECVERNKQYLMKTCPSVVKPNTESNNVSQSDISEYFRRRLWPYGIVNYKIKDNIEFTYEEREYIKAVIQHIEKATCVIFRDLSKEIGYDRINDSDGNTYTEKHDSDNEITTNDENDNIMMKLVKDDKNELRKGTKTMVDNKTSQAQQTRRHARSTLTFVRSPEPGCPCPHSGKPDGNKVLTINSDCFNSVNDLLHHFVHLLGLDHQHNMHDRDSYLHIQWENLTPDLKTDMMNKLPPAASVGFDYDYQSVMHYPWLQIKNGVTNIMYPIWNDGWAMGHWQGLSTRDVQKINFIYYDECLKRQKSGYKVVNVDS